MTRLLSWVSETATLPIANVATTRAFELVAMLSDPSRPRSSFGSTSNAVCVFAGLPERVKLLVRGRRIRHGNEYAIFAVRKFHRKVNIRRADDRRGRRRADIHRDMNEQVPGDRIVPRVRYRKTGPGQRARLRCVRRGVENGSKSI